MDLLKNASSDESSDFRVIRKGTYFFELTGTLDGVTAALEIKRGSDAQTLEVASLSAEDIVAVDLPGCLVRATLSSSGASTDVTVRL